MFLAIYLEVGADLEDVERRLKDLFPEAKITMSKAAVNLDVPPYEEGAMIREKVSTVDGVGRADWIS